MPRKKKLTLTDWKPADEALFTADYAQLMTNAQLAAHHSVSMGILQRYLQQSWRDGKLVPRKDLPGWGTKTNARAAASLAHKVVEAPDTSSATGEIDERETAADGTVHLNIQTQREIKTLADLIEHCNLDTTAYEITNYKVKKWDTAIKAQDTDEEGHITWRMEVRQMFAVSATLKPRVAMVTLRDEVERMLVEMREAAPKKWPVYNHAPSDPNRKYMLELSITDAHFGKLAWWKESGESYDLKIAEDIFIAAIEDLVSKAGAYSFDEILFVVGNDLFNADNRNNTTFAGTIQSTDVRYQKTFTTVRRVIQDVIERFLRPRAKRVRVLMVCGNHDTDTVFMFGEVLDAYFHHCDDVIIDNQPTQRKYAEFGQCMLMFTHGSEEKHNELPLIMAQERKEMWGRTRYREVHLGHFHKRKQLNWVGLDEHKGVSLRILPSLCAAEDWHTSKGYIGNIRSAEAYVWDAEQGLCAQFYYTVPPFSK